MKLFAIVFMMLIGTASFAQPRVCFVGQKPAEEQSDKQYFEQDSSIQALLEEAFVDDAFYYQTNYRAPSCKTLKKIKDVSSVLEISLGIGGVVMACTGAGLPATALVSSAVLGLQILEFVVDKIDCIDIERDEKLQAQIKSMVCTELNRAGHLCEVQP